MIEFRDVSKRFPDGTVAVEGLSLIAMNARSSGEEKAASEQIAADWVAESGLFGEPL